MKRIALSMAVLALSAGAAFAASPAQPAATTTPKTHHVSAAARNNMVEQRMTKALNLLEAKGYGAFENFKADGQDYSATVIQSGHSMTILVDPDSGRVTT
jgi:hypothetical protein